ncbi:hypothetical protein CKM354_000716500 [Cercospora kikuchii]|uniref:C2H2-type domain-containing protein n=1 Tax=Cercospora kikuchii TaxID=84275 RepID=A0A9P3CKN6_9PEZI|nr:uncharacterized protein CKM354_000716500 [Cercospora kikuchii]GIZ43956.1 hypothetical protein CKM354_000716500 [Cercospora kikuchii]
MSARSFPCKYCGRECNSGPGRRAHEKSMHEGISSRSKTAAPGARALAERPRGQALATSSSPAAAPSAPSPAGAAGPSRDPVVAALGTYNANMPAFPDNTGPPAGPLSSPLAARGSANLLAAQQSPTASRQPEPLQKKAGDYARDHRFHGRGQEISKLSWSDFQRLTVVERLKYQDWYDQALNEMESAAKESVAHARSKQQRDDEADVFLAGVRGQRLAWVQQTGQYVEEYGRAIRTGLAMVREERDLAADLNERVKEVAVAATPELGSEKVQKAIRTALEQAES